MTGTSNKAGTSNLQTTSMRSINSKIDVVLLMSEAALLMTELYLELGVQRARQTHAHEGIPAGTVALQRFEVRTNKLDYVAALLLCGSRIRLCTTKNGVSLSSDIQSHRVCEPLQVGFETGHWKTLISFPAHMKGISSPWAVAGMGYNVVDALVNSANQVHFWT